MSGKMQAMTQRLDLSVECVLDVRDTVGESPVWSAREGTLYWVDILAAKIQRWDPVTNTPMIYLTSGPSLPISRR